MNGRTVILERLERLPDTAVFREAKAWIKDNQTTSLFDDPLHVSVADALHVWRVRLAISKDRGNKILGGESLVSRLNELTKNLKLEQYSFASEGQAGSVFFEKTSGKFVGMAIAAKSKVTQYAHAS